MRKLGQRGDEVIGKTGVKTLQRKNVSVVGPRLRRKGDRSYDVNASQVWGNPVGIAVASIDFRRVWIRLHVSASGCQEPQKCLAAIGKSPSGKGKRFSILY
jgi:hypothetical protein